MYHKALFWDTRFLFYILLMFVNVNKPKLKVFGTSCNVSKQMQICVNTDIIKKVKNLGFKMDTDMHFKKGVNSVI